MSKLKTNTIQHTGGSADNLTLDNSQNVTAEGNLTVDGNVSVGTTTSIQKLTIDGGGISIDNGWNTQWGANASRAYIQGEDATGNNRLIFGTNNTERLRLDSSGNAQITDGNLVVASGHGIDFSAAASGNSPDATLFKDYEEGTFTPRLGGTTNLSTVYANGSGSYTKIGRVVTIICRFNAVNESMTGQIAISNLPFNSINDGSNYATSCDWLSHSVAWGDNMHPGFMMDATNNRWTGYLSRDDASWIDWMVGDWDANGLYLNFQGTYWTNA